MSSDSDLEGNDARHLVGKKFKSGLCLQKLNKDDIDEDFERNNSIGSNSSFNSKNIKNVSSPVSKSYS
jgi:hypothetical protein